jgi:DeoR family transcriptional regulator, suf operon transcriptional repressor
MNLHLAPAEFRASDAAVIELLRVDDRLGVGDLAKRLGVTATAVRQRLDRLMRAGVVGRTTVPGGLSAAGEPGGSRLRGRPSHVYSLTEKGRRTGGDNFRDLALVLWREIRSVREPAVRQGLISRIGSAMAGMYRDEVSGATPRQRLESTAKILQERRIPCGVEPSSDPSNHGLPVLTSYACPYPELAEQDRGICAAERAMLQDLVGSAVRLSECRLDGASCCRFTVGSDNGPAGVENDALPATGATCIKPD